MNVPSISSRSGFTMLQLSVALAVGGIILAAALPGQNTGRANQQISDTAQRIEAIKIAVGTYKARNKYVPCPADPTLAVSNASFGTEDRSGGAGTACDTMYGAVPVRALGLSDDFAIDGWGRRITFKVDTNLATYDGCEDLMDGTDAYALAIASTTSVAPTDNPITCNSSNSDYKSCASVAIISHGKDGHGAYPAQGGATVLNKGFSGSNYYRTLTNARMGSPVVIQKMQDTYFDDQVDYVTGCKTTGSDPCTKPWGGTLNHSDSVTAYQAATVNAPASCVSETRTCTNGSLSGSYGFASCSVLAVCNLPWGGTLASGQNVTAYQAATVNAPSSCTSEVRTCTNGVLSGSYTNQSCSVNATCSLDGQTIAHGDSGTWYSDTTSPLGAACSTIALSRTCNNGTLSGSGSFSHTSCTERPCTYPWGGSMAHGTDVTAYIATERFAPDSCTNETRSCSYGNLSGSYTAAACTAYATRKLSEGNTNSAFVGTDVLFVDLDDDGKQDMAIGSATGISEVHLVWGQSPTLSSTPVSLPVSDVSNDGFLLTNTTGTAFGTNFGKGDVNDDGIEDLLIGANTENTSDGCVYIVYGHATRTNFSASQTMATLRSANKAKRICGASGVSERLGYAVAAGDVNDDGYDDLVVGAYNYGDAFYPYGAVYIVWGSSWGSWSDDAMIDTLVGSGYATRLRHDGVAGDEDSIGFTVAADDVTGDGKDDLIVGGSDFTPFLASGGNLYVVHNRGTWTNNTLIESYADGTNGFMFDGPDSLNVASYGIAIGDINDDGTKDIAMGGSADVGYVVFGVTSGRSATVTTAEILGTSGGFRINDDRSGTSPLDMAFGDTDGDGDDDLVIGTRAAQVSAVAYGVTNIVFGTSSAFCTPVALSSGNCANGGSTYLRGAASGDQFGTAVSVGLMNSGTAAEVLVGARLNDPNSTTNGGSAYIFHGVSAWGSSQTAP